MSPEIIGLAGIGVMVVLLFSGMYTGLVMALVGFFGIVCILGFHQAFAVAGTASYNFISNYSFSVAPMFMFMGNIVAITGIGVDLFETAYKWIGRLRGGLAAATVAASGLFAAIVGDSSSGIMVFSKVALPAMKKLKYDEKLSTGSIAAGATLGILIPPSIGFVMYGILTEQSVGKLFMAGIIPGILQVFFYIIAIYIMCRIQPSLGPSGPSFSLKEKFVSLRNVWPTATLFLLVMGGIYTGVCTPTEGGAIGALGAIIITILNKRMTGGKFVDIVLDTGLMVGMFMLLMAGIPFFQKFMAISELPIWLGNIIDKLNVPPLVVMIAIIIMYLILGTALPAMMCIVLTIPIIYPLIISLGFNPIWFGVICVRMVEIGDISPPEGMNVFILSGISGIPIPTIFRGVMPFILADFFHVALLVAVPSISTFLPSHM